MIDVTGSVETTDGSSSLTIRADGSLAVALAPAPDGPGAAVPGTTLMISVLLYVLTEPDGVLYKQALAAFVSTVAARRAAH